MTGASTKAHPVLTSVLQECSNRRTMGGQQGRIRLSRLLCDCPVLALCFSLMEPRQTLSCPAPVAACFHLRQLSSLSAAFHSSSRVSRLRPSEALPTQLHYCSPSTLVSVKPVCSAALSLQTPLNSGLGSLFPLRRVDM